MCILILEGIMHGCKEYTISELDRSTWIYDKSTNNYSKYNKFILQETSYFVGDRNDKVSELQICNCCLLK